MLRAQQRDATIERLAFAVEVGQARLCQFDILSQTQPGEQTAFTLHQMVSEVSHQTDAEHRSSNEPRPLPDLLQDHHRVRESRTSHGVNYLFGRDVTICRPPSFR